MQDYVVLKERKPSILEEIKTKLTDWREKKYFDKNKPTFKYSEERQAVGIFLKEGRRERIILSGEDIDAMSDIEEKIFFATRDILIRGLKGIKVGKEKWE
jgi:hypothetical protein